MKSEEFLPAPAKSGGDWRSAAADALLARTARDAGVLLWGSPLSCGGGGGSGGGLALLSGAYRVTVGAGGPSFYDDTNLVRNEGVRGNATSLVRISSGQDAVQAALGGGFQFDYASLDEALQALVTGGG